MGIIIKKIYSYMCNHICIHTCHRLVVYKQAYDISQEDRTLYDTTPNNNIIIL